MSMSVVPWWWFCVAPVGGRNRTVAAVTVNSVVWWAFLDMGSVLGFPLPKEEF